MTIYSAGIILNALGIYIYYAKNYADLKSNKSLGFLFCIN